MNYVPVERQKCVLAGNEADELRNAFLDGVLCVLCNLPVSGQRLLHDATYVRDWEETILLPNARTWAPFHAAATLMTPTAIGTIRHSFTEIKTLAQQQKNPIKKPPTQSD